MKTPQLRMRTSGFEKARWPGLLLVVLLFAVVLTVADNGWAQAGRDRFQRNRGLFTERRFGQPFQPPQRHYQSGIRRDTAGTFQGIERRTGTPGYRAGLEAARQQRRSEWLLVEPRSAQGGTEAATSQQQSFWQQSPLLQSPTMEQMEAPWQQMQLPAEFPQPLGSELLPGQQPEMPLVEQPGVGPEMPPQAFPPAQQTAVSGQTSAGQTGGMSSGNPPAEAGSQMAGQSAVGQAVGPAGIPAAPTASPSAAYTGPIYQSGPPTVFIPNPRRWLSSFRASEAATRQEMTTRFLSNQERARLLSLRINHLLGTRVIKPVLVTIVGERAILTGVVAGEDARLVAKNTVLLEPGIWEVDDRIQVANNSPQTSQQ